MSTLLAFQLRRVGRNRQFLFFTVLLPALFTVFFTEVFGAQAGTGSAYQEYATGSMVAMMAYGGMGAALGATIRISFDRASGWLRQLRVTPVPASSVVAVDVLVGVLLVLPGLVVVALVGRFVNGVQLALPTWVALVAVLWLGSGAFVALGLLIGHALEEKAAGAAIGVVGTVLAALGGLWVPVELFPGGLRVLAHVLPSYWYAELGRDVVALGAPAPGTVLAVAAFAVAAAVLTAAVVRRRPSPAVAGRAG
ncbi:ABC transporter permease [Geodermatophilus sp. DSM 45219]|uniref:ABC transporter permease n=1 Tax=Geodermatophilus sp. DSM 45219 TaxID=1881103 RepID=UPI0008927915|nr:ABC transporter permease [Geodermatophilus sp. DSM 45219]SDO18191.1 ABC-2 type transport system permease protein [Geodermatophilus sp. DSM 45219]